MSKLLFLGTGAADWILENKEPGFRRNSAAVVNGELMLDCGSHILDYAESIQQQSLLGGVTHLLITHVHSDHLHPQTVRTLAQRHPLSIACCREAMARIGSHENIEFVPIVPYREFSFGGYRVMPLLANHDVIDQEGRQAFHFIITTPEEKVLFYGLDGAWFLRPSWEEMLRYRFDVMVLDCTVGDRDDWRMFEHNTIPMLRMMCGQIREKGLLKPDGKIIASHLARTLHPVHGDTEAILRQDGIITAFDSMELQF